MGLGFRVLNLRFKVRSLGFNQVFGIVSCIFVASEIIMAHCWRCMLQSFIGNPINAFKISFSLLILPHLESIFTPR